MIFISQKLENRAFKQQTAKIICFIKYYAKLNKILYANFTQTN